MSRSDNLYELPRGLPVPQDDGACAHLAGMRVPSIALRATDDTLVDLAAIDGRTVVYCYPRTGRPDQPSPDGWNETPGARGCTPQSCGFRDQHQDIRALGIRAVYGLSAQNTEYQREAVERLHLPFALLSDERLEFTRALNLPTFDFDGVTLIKRLTLIVMSGTIEHVFYPVFPPDSNAQAVILWLVEHGAR